jgi:hypothetical protein
MRTGSVTPLTIIFPKKSPGCGSNRTGAIRIAYAIYTEFIDSPQE